VLLFVVDRQLVELMVVEIVDRAEQHLMHVKDWLK
jgi:hypothetical protein